MSCSRNGFSCLGVAPVVVLRRLGDEPSMPMDILRWWKESWGEVDMDRLRETSRRRVFSPFCFWGILMFSVRAEAGMMGGFADGQRQSSADVQDVSIYAMSCDSMDGKSVEVAGDSPPRTGL